MPAVSLRRRDLGLALGLRRRGRCWRWLAAAGVWRALPDGIRPPALSLADWRTVFTHPVLMAIVAVTAMSSAGQFTLFSYFAPYYRQVLGASAGADQPAVPVVRRRRPGRQRAADAQHRPHRRRHRGGADAGAAWRCRCWPGRWPPACRQCAAGHRAVGAGLLRVELGAAGAAGAGRAGAGHGADLAELVGHVPGPVRRRGQRRRDDRRRRLRRR